jgi:hypothetical protein
MEMNKLYVIGNGFDKHHKMPCGYGDFKNWLINNRHDVYNNLVRLYGDVDVDWWSKFEENLTNFDPNRYPNEVGRTPFFELQRKLVELYGEEGRAAIDNYELADMDGIANRYHLAEAIAHFEMERLNQDLNEAFGEWVRSIDVPANAECVENLDTDATFFTFNYTRTLEDLYGVDEDRVLHLHGSVDNGRFVIGHGLSVEEMLDRDTEENAYERDPDDDMGEDEARLELFQVIADQLRKPVEEIMDMNSNHFNDLEAINEMEVLGFSYSKIDLPYLRRIFEVVGTDIHVKFGWHSDEDRTNAGTFANEMGLTNCELMYF